MTQIHLGPRPFYLLDQLKDGPLKQSLLACQDAPAKTSVFSIAHRGAPLQFPEHTKESYLAAARMGAGVLECDVSFTKDKALVCRHSQCDLHTTTNILATPLAAKCSQPFQPAQFDAKGNLVKAASAKCCTSDITLAEFKTLEGKMDAANPRATTVEEYLAGTPHWRTDLYAGSGTLMTLDDSITLFKQLGVKMTPELKEASVPMPFNGMSQSDYAQKMIDAHKALGVPAEDVFAQSFHLEDIRYWIANEPAFAKQAIYLDDEIYKQNSDESPDAGAIQKQIAAMPGYKKEGIQIIAPPIWALLTVKNGAIVPSDYAKAAKAAGLEIITWSLERSGLLKNGGDWFYQTITKAIDNEGDALTVLDVLAQQVNVKGVFSDWPATVTFYANCKGL